MSDSEPVFRLKPETYSDSCLIKHVGYINDNQKLGDELLEFETPENIQKQYGKNVDIIDNILSYIVKVYMYHNNVTGSYILKNDYIPVYSLSVVYEKNIVAGPLFDIFIGFKLDEECTKLKKNPKKLVNSKVSGSYQIKLLCDDNVMEDIDVFYNNIGIELINTSEILEKVTKLSEEEFSKYLEDEINTQTNYIKNLLSGVDIKVKSVSHTIENILKPLYSNNKLNLFIKFALQKREEKRRKLYKASESYELPKRVLNIKDVENNDKYLNEYLGIN